MEDWQKLAYDHEQTVKYFHALADARFKLLELIPVVTGGAVVALNPIRFRAGCSGYSGS